MCHIWLVTESALKHSKSSYRCVDQPVIASMEAVKDNSYTQAIFRLVRVK